MIFLKVWGQCDKRNTYCSYNLLKITRKEITVFYVVMKTITWNISCHYLYKNAVSLYKNAVSLKPPLLCLLFAPFSSTYPALSPPKKKQAAAAFSFFNLSDFK